MKLSMSGKLMTGTLWIERKRKKKKKIIIIIIIIIKKKNQEILMCEISSHGWSINLFDIRL